MIDILQEKTRQHTPQYTQYAQLLMGQKTYTQSGELKDIAIYTPQDDCAIYSITNYMTDNELAFINSERVKFKKSILPRLAYIGGGNYYRCYNQLQKINLEKEKFAESVCGDVRNLKAGVKWN